MCMVESKHAWIASCRAHVGAYAVDACDARIGVAPLETRAQIGYRSHPSETTDVCCALHGLAVRCAETSVSQKAMRGRGANARARMDVGTCSRLGVSLQWMAHRESLWSRS